MAQIGSDSSFYEFCTSVCLSLYEAQQQQRPALQAAETSDSVRCSVCYKTGEVSKGLSLWPACRGRPPQEFSLSLPPVHPSLALGEGGPVASLRPLRFHFRFSTK